MPPEAVDITRKFKNRHVRILVKRDELTLQGIKQFYVNVEKEEWKLETLCEAITQSVIFVNTRRKVDWLTDKMRSHDTVWATHGDMDQNTRDIIMREFRSVFPCSYHHRSASTWYRCSTGLPRYKLWSANSARKLPSSYWTKWAVWKKRCCHQFLDWGRWKNAVWHSKVLQCDDRGTAVKCCSTPLMEECDIFFAM